MRHIRLFLKSQVFRFLLVGLLCASIEYILFTLFLNLTNYLMANVIAITLAITLNYFFSKVYIFGKSKYSMSGEFFSFVFFSLLAIALNQFILWFLVEYPKVDIHLSKAITIVTVAFFNFTTKKYIVFKG